MTEAHTPGPWVARRMHTGGFDIMDPRNRDVVTVYGGGVETESREANARLIAAAPDYHTAAREIDRLALVIESAVRFSDPTNLAAVRAALKANQAAILKATTPNAGERG